MAADRDAHPERTPNPKGDPAPGEGRGPHPGREADSWDELVLDEDFIRDAEAVEPSARARMLAVRWRASAPEPRPWRSDEPAAGWFWSRAGRRRRWRRGRR